MGGDDLGSDDEYLNPSLSGTDASSFLEKLDKTEETSSNKRRRDDSGGDESVDKMPSKKSSSHILIETGRDLANESAEVQCAFLQKALTHEVQLRGNSVDKLTKLMPSHFSTSKESTLEARMRGAVSMKKLRKYKTLKSPMVLIVCLSARRAVAVLKELASLKLRAAKLFAKHMDVSQQRTMLTQHAYGLAVGTPHRLLALCQEDEPALNLNHTSLVILDSHVSPKGYTVCTLPDTAGDCMELLRQIILPQLKKRKDLQIAIF